MDHLNYPLATSSANISGMANSADFAKLITEFKNDVAIFIKGDVSSDLQASTVAIVDNGKEQMIFGEAYAFLNGNYYQISKNEDCLKFSPDILKKQQNFEK